MKLTASFWIASLTLLLFSPVAAQNAPSASLRAAAPIPRFVCSAGYSLDECRGQMNVLRKALAKYPVAQLGTWTWVLVRSRDWRHVLLERGLDPDRPAFSFLPKRETFFDEALVLPVSTRGTELSALWHMTIEDLFDLAVTHELAHALCNEKDEAKASRVAKMLKDGISPSCATNIVGKTESQRSHGTLLLASQVSSVSPNIPVLPQHFVCTSSYTLKHCKTDMRVLKVALPFSSAAQQDPTAGSSAASPEMPFQLHRGYLIVVEGRVGTLSGLKFMLDTGVTYSILDTKIAGSLNLSVLRHPRHVVNYDKRVSIESATIPEVQFGPVQRTNQEMFIADLSKFSDFARDVDALIGLDLLQLNNVTFDFNVRKVLFSPIHDHNVEGLQMRSEPVCFTVKVQVQGHPVHLILDTGLEGVLLYEDRIRTKIPGLRMGAETERVTIGGRMNAKLATLPEMRLGSTLMDGRVLLMEGPPGNIMEGIDGYIGIAPFNTKRITFNFASKTINWE